MEGLQKDQLEMKSKLQQVLKMLDKARLLHELEKSCTLVPLEILNRLDSPKFVPFLTTFLNFDTTEWLSNKEYNHYLMANLLASGGHQERFFEKMEKLLKNPQLVSALKTNNQRVPSKTCFMFVHYRVIPALFSCDYTAGEKQEFCNLLMSLPLGFAYQHMSPEAIKSFKNDIVQKYLPTLSPSNPIKDWRSYCNALIWYSGQILHHEVDLTNAILRVVESGFKTKTIEDRCAAYDCWKTLIDNYKQNEDFLNSTKQIRLLVKPLKAKLSKNPIVTVKRFDTYVYLICSLKNPELVLEDFLFAILGPFNDTIDHYSNNDRVNSIRDVSELCPKITEILIKLLGNHKESCLCNTGNTYDLQPISKFDNVQVLLDSVLNCTLLIYYYKLMKKSKCNVNCDVVRCLWKSFFGCAAVTSSVDHFEGLGRALDVLVKSSEMRANNDTYVSIIQYTFASVFQYLVSLESYENPSLVASVRKILILMSYYAKCCPSIVLGYYQKACLVRLETTDGFLDFVCDDLVKLPSPYMCECLLFILGRINDDQRASKNYSNFIGALMENIIKLLSNPEINVMNGSLSLATGMDMKIFDMIRVVAIKNENYIAGILKFCWMLCDQLNEDHDAIYNELVNIVAHCLSLTSLDNANKDLKNLLKIGQFEKLFKLRKLYKSPNDAALCVCVQSLIVKLKMEEIVVPFYREVMQIHPPSQFPILMRSALLDLVSSPKLDVAKHSKMLLQMTGKLSKSDSPSTFLTPTKVDVKKHSLDDIQAELFVPIDNAVVFDKRKMTDRQKEVMTKRRTDIPALYQDLSQQSQSIDASDSNSNQPTETNVIATAPTDNDNAMDVLISKSNEDAESGDDENSARSENNKISTYQRRSLKSLQMDIVGADNFINLPRTRRVSKTSVPESTDSKPARRSSGQKSESSVDERPMKLQKSPSSEAINEESEDIIPSTQDSPTNKPLSLKPFSLKSSKHVDSNEKKTVSARDNEKPSDETLTLHISPKKAKITLFSVSPDLSKTLKLGKTIQLRLNKEESLNQTPNNLDTSLKMEHIQNTFKQFNTSSKLKSTSGIKDVTVETEEIPTSSSIPNNIMDTFTYMEAKHGEPFDEIMTIQANPPLLTNNVTVHLKKLGQLIKSPFPKHQDPDTESINFASIKTAKKCPSNTDTSLASQTILNFSELTLDLTPQSPTKNIPKPESKVPAGLKKRQTGRVKSSRKVESPPKSRSSRLVAEARNNFDDTLTLPVDEEPHNSTGDDTMTLDTKHEIVAKEGDSISVTSNTIENTPIPSSPKKSLISVKSTSKLSPSKSINKILTQNTDTLGAAQLMDTETYNEVIHVTSSEEKNINSKKDANQIDNISTGTSEKPAEKPSEKPLENNLKRNKNKQNSNKSPHKFNSILVRKSKDERINALNKELLDETLSLYEKPKSASIDGPQGPPVQTEVTTSKEKVKNQQLLKLAKVGKKSQTKIPSEQLIMNEEICRKTKGPEPKAQLSPTSKSVRISLKSQPTVIEATLADNSKVPSRKSPPSPTHSGCTVNQPENEQTKTTEFVTSTENTQNEDKGFKLETSETKSPGPKVQLSPVSKTLRISLNSQPTVVEATLADNSKVPSRKSPPSPSHSGLTVNQPENEQTSKTTEFDTSKEDTQKENQSFKLETSNINNAVKKARRSLPSKSYKLMFARNSANKIEIKSTRKTILKAKTATINTRKSKDKVQRLRKMKEGITNKVKSIIDNKLIDIAPQSEQTEQSFDSDKNERTEVVNILNGLSPKESKNVDSNVETETLHQIKLIPQKSADSETEEKPKSALENEEIIDAVNISLNDAETESILSNVSLSLHQETPSFLESRIVGSPTNQDTPVKRSELFQNTLNISPIRVDAGNAKSPGNSDLKDEAPINDFSNIDVNVDHSEDSLKKAGRRSEKLLHVYGKVAKCSSPNSKSVNRPVKSVSSPQTNRIRLMMLNCGEAESNNAVQVCPMPDANNILTFNREVPSPLATPKISILKRKAVEVIDESSSPSAKRKRVNFSDPPTTSEKIFFKSDEENKNPCKKSSVRLEDLLYAAEVEEANNEKANKEIETVSESSVFSPIKELLAMEFPSNPSIESPERKLRVEMLTKMFVNMKSFANDINEFYEAYKNALNDNDLDVLLKGNEHSIHF